MWVGLTGGIGCGKSTVAEIIRQKGYFVIDADQISRKLTEVGEVGYKAIVQEFGSNVLKFDQSLDRKKLAEIVFSSKGDLERLEGVLHPLIKKEVEAQKKEHTGKIIFYDVPLLFEKKMAKEFDKIISVVCSEDNQIKRLILRSGLDISEIKKRISAQVPHSLKIKNSDYVIKNDGNLDSLNKEVDEVIEGLRRA